MVGSVGFDEIITNIGLLEQRIEDRAEWAGRLTGSQMQSYAKQNRPWTDRTGVARASLSGTSEKQGDRIRVVLSIGPYYGVFLELANGGKWRIIVPTVNRYRQTLLDNLKAVASL